jgi:hypothetical protein
MAKSSAGRAALAEARPAAAFFGREGDGTFGYLRESLAQFRPDTILLLNGLDVARYEIPGA